MRWHIAQIDVEAMLPQNFPRVGIEAHHALLLHLSLFRRVLQVEMVAQDDGRRTTAIGRLPRKVFSRGRPLQGKVLLRRAAISGGTSPLRPVIPRRWRDQELQKE